MKDLQDYARRALALTTEIVRQYGARLAGSAAVKQTAERLHQEVASFSSASGKESFAMHPRAFLDWIRILVAVYVISVGLLWLGFAPAAFLLLAAGLAMMVWQFFLYREVVDPLFPRQEGFNVWAVVEPSDEVRQEFIICGHHDSARIFNFFIHQPGLYALRVMGGIGTLAALTLYALGLSIAQAVQGSLFRLPGGEGALLVTVLNSIFTLLILLVGQLWFFASDKGTPGAGDNLISSAIAIEVGRYFSKQRTRGEGLRHTRVRVLSFDGEEAGLRGARRYFQRHAAEYAGLPAWCLNIDCPYALSDFFFLTSDINGSVQLSSSMAADCVRLAHAAGYPAIHKPIAFLTGGTDAAEAAKVGVRAVTLMGMPWGNSERASVYHTSADLPESIEPRAIEAAIHIAVDFAVELDGR